MDVKKRQTRLLLTSIFLSRSRMTDGQKCLKVKMLYGIEFSNYQDEETCMKERIIPIPRMYEETAGKVLCLKNGFEIVNDADNKEAEALLNEKAGSFLKEGGLKVVLTYGKAPEEAVYADQGYALTADGEKIVIEGFGEAGLYYGALTLCQMLGKEFEVPAVKIVDWPDMKTRGHFMECRFGSNTMTLDDWKDVVDHMASMKMNQLVVAVYGCWCVQYDGRVSEYMYIPVKKYPKLKTPVVRRYFNAKENKWVDEEKLPPMFEQDFFGDLCAYGKTKHVEVFPLWNSYGHNTLIPNMYPEVSAKDENGEPTLTGFCTSNPKTYEVLFGCYDEIIDRHLLPNGIRSFHVGMDEVWDGIAQNAEDIYRVRSPWCKCPVCRDIPRQQLYINHAIKVLNHMKEKGMENIYMYHDMLKNHGGAMEGSNDSTNAMMEALQANGLTENVIIDWWTYNDYKEGLTFDTTQPEQGLRRTVKPWNGYYHWNNVFHPIRNNYMLAKMAHEEGVEGLQSYSAWDRSFDRVHNAQADFSWNFEGTGDSQDASDAYVMSHFPGKAAAARRAFTLLDACTGTNRKKEGDVIKDFGGYELTMSRLSYYFYSYVRAGKPYPRSFPGEAVEWLLEQEWESRIQLAGLAAMGAEARRLFLEVAEDDNCDTRMALRYAWEANHSRTMAEDFLALLDMHDLYQKDKIANIPAIRELAKERMNARLDLMKELQDNKEDFLWPSHLRNHSIYMQFFKDLDEYLEKTPAEDVELNFADFSNVASDQFWKLR